MYSGKGVLALILHSISDEDKCLATAGSALSYGLGASTLTFNFFRSEEEPAIVSGTDIRIQELSLHSTEQQYQDAADSPFDSLAKYSWSTKNARGVRQKPGLPRVGVGRMQGLWCSDKANTIVSFHIGNRAYRGAHTGPHHLPLCHCRLWAPCPADSPRLPPRPNLLRQPAGHTPLHPVSLLPNRDGLADAFLLHPLPLSPAHRLTREQGDSLPCCLPRRRR